MNNRFENWPTLLHAFIKERATKPLEWGKTDCITLAIDWIERATGKRVWDVTWTNEQEANALLESLGGIREAITSVLGDEIDDPWLAERGSIALVPTRDSFAAGVVLDQFVAVQGERGIAMISIRHIVTAWVV